MTVEIKYHAEIKNETISSYTRKWATEFGDMLIENDTGDNHYFQSGTYNSDGFGDLYAFMKKSDQQDGINVAMVTGFKTKVAMENDFDQHITPGLSGKLAFGESIIPIPESELDNSPDGDNIYFQLQNTQLSFKGLDNTDDIEYSFYMFFHSQSHPHCPSGKSLGVYSLLRGDAEPILAKLKEQGVDVDIPLKDMAIANQFYAMPVNSPVIDTVGVTEGSEVLLAA
ncbi:heme acquisition protein HasA [Yersinia frederiksenii]|uniref:heme acquisition protein HasA n=1 Tax=Yersinia frederiksenii TaxID=29484 RepID=UPI0025AAD398|nr:heme acquisition protein HasA [Yersinia frederiksenii]MDN0119501.1 heme acquisition protein HasA [Yersinia frederiksenii]